MEQRILHNRAKCLVCGDIIESTAANDTQRCSCGNLYVGGGRDHIQRKYKQGRLSFVNMIEYELDPSDPTGKP